MRETHVYDGNTYHKIEWAVNYLNQYGDVVRTYNSDGTITESSWGCCGKDSETDRLGIETSYEYDDLHRVLTATKDGGGTGDDVVMTYTYDGYGRQLTQTTSAGGLSLSESNTYDLVGRVRSSTDSAGLLTAYDYQDGGNVTRVTRPGGATEVTTKYPDGRIRSTTGSAIVPRYYEYGVNTDGTQWRKVYMGRPDSSMWEKTTTDMAGRTVEVEKPGFSSVEVTENYFDDMGGLTKTTRPGVADTLYEYDQMGNNIRTGLDVDGNGTLDLVSSDRITESKTIYTFFDENWWRERIRRVYAAESDDTATTLNAERTRLTGLGQGGLIGEVVTVDIHGNNTVLQTFIDRVARTETRVLDYPDSAIDAITANRNGLLVSSKSKTGVNTTFLYDALERRIGVTDPRIGTTTTHYNNRGWVDYVEDPAGNRTEFVYDPETGRKTVEKNALGKAVRYAYNDQGQIMHIWGEATYPVQYIYDMHGRITEMHTWRSGSGWEQESWPIDPGASSDVTRWHYHEPTGLLLSKEDAAGEEVSYAYGLGGKLSTRTWARTEDDSPIVTSYLYDDGTGELRGIDYSDTTSDISFTYDRQGKEKTVSDAVGTRTFVYNEALQLEAEIISGLYDKVISRAYETSGVPGRPNGFSAGEDYSVTHGYDAVGRINSIGWDVGSSSDSASYSYLENSDLLKQLTTPSGQLTAYLYEPHRNVRIQVRNEFSGDLISEYDYTYDELERKRSVINSGEAFAPVENAFNLFAYNDRSELTTSKRYIGTDITDLSQPVDSETRIYQYDPIGNRTDATEGSETSSYAANNLNQYDSITADGNTVSLSYDEDGNLIAKGGMVFKYNAENRLISVEPATPVDGDTKIENTYDYMGRRVKKTAYRYQDEDWTPEAGWRFVYYGWHLIEELEDTGGGQQAYIWGLDLSGSLDGAGGIGGLLSSINRTNSRHYCFDANGNVSEVISSPDGGVAAHYEYAPYGNIICKNGLYADDNRFRFSTKYRDDETGLDYFGRRYSSPEMGRWISRDALREAGGINLYVFANNLPTSYFDPLGLKPSKCSEISVRITRTGGKHATLGRLEVEAEALVGGGRQPLFYTDGYTLELKSSRQVEVYPFSESGFVWEPYDLKTGYGRKVYPIPTGTYKAEASRYHNHFALLLENKPRSGFEEIFIHIGNFPWDTDGCIVVGTKQERDYDFHRSRLSDKTWQNMIRLGMVSGVTLAPGAMSSAIYRESMMFGDKTTAALYGDKGKTDAVLHSGTMLSRIEELYDAVEAIYGDDATFLVEIQ